MVDIISRKENFTLIFRMFYVVIIFVKLIAWYLLYKNECF